MNRSLAQQIRDASDDPETLMTLALQAADALEEGADEIDETNDLLEKTRANHKRAIDDTVALSQDLDTARKDVESHRLIAESWYNRAMWLAKNDAFLKRIIEETRSKALKHAAATSYHT